MDTLIEQEPGLARAAAAAPQPGPRELRVLVVARQPVVRAGLRGLLEDHHDFQVVGLASTADDATQTAASLQPDTVLAAWDGGRLDEVLLLAAELGAQGIPLVVLSDAPGAVELGALLRAGVRGILLSDATADDVHATLRAAVQGLLVLDPMLGRTWSALVPATRPEELLTDEPLTDREREVLDLLALGLPNKNIAKRLNISEHTVKFHVGSILSKLEASSRTEAVTRAARRGLLAL